MKYILFLMFFIAPPAKPADRVWALQSTTTMEFPTLKDCKDVGAEIQNSVASTATVTTRGWCFGKASAAGPADAKALTHEEKPLDAPVLIEKLASPPSR